jgi:hypothetical protein
MKSTLVVSLLVILSASAHGQTLKDWNLAKAITYKIARGGIPSAVCEPARDEYFLLLVEDSESIVVYQRPGGTCMFGFPSQNHRNAFHIENRLVLTQPIDPDASGRSIVWNKATLDKAGTTAEFYKLKLQRSEGGVIDTVFLSRKGSGTLVQWILS